MATTRYIVNNLENQTIIGSLNIAGTVSTNYGVYRALLCQTGTMTGYSLDDYNGGLIIGEEYTISEYVEKDDFSNIANVISGEINTTGCIFIATGEMPNNWSNGSELTSNGSYVISNVLENTLDFDIEWNIYEDNTYIGCKKGSRFLTNTFPRSKTEVKFGIKNTFYTPIGSLITGGVRSISWKDDSVFIGVSIKDTYMINKLYYDSVEINIKKDLDVTPIRVFGEIISEFPIQNTSVRLLANQEIVGEIFGESKNEIINEKIPISDTKGINDINELIEFLNSDSNTSQLGKYSTMDGKDNSLVLTTTQNIKNQFAPDTNFSFEVFNNRISDNKNLT